jgi:hypothetical protein
VTSPNTKTTAKNVEHFTFDIAIILDLINIFCHVFYIYIIFTCDIYISISIADAIVTTEAISTASRPSSHLFRPRGAIVLFDGLQDH